MCASASASALYVSGYVSVSGVHVCLHLYLHVYLCLQMSVSVYVYICVYASVSASASVSAPVSAPVSVSVFASVHVFVYVSASSCGESLEMFDMGSAGRAVYSGTGARFERRYGAVSAGWFRVGNPVYLYLIYRSNALPMPWLPERRNRPAPHHDLTTIKSPIEA
jgi:hypothetical protein